MLCWKCWSCADVDDEKEESDLLQEKAAYIDNYVINGLFSDDIFGHKEAVKH